MYAQPSSSPISCSQPRPSGSRCRTTPDSASRSCPSRPASAGPSSEVGLAAFLPCGLRRVEADRGEPGVHADPRRRLGLVAEARLQLLDALRRIGHRAGPLCSSSSRLVAARPHTTSAWGLAFSARSLAVMTPGRVADPLDLDVRMVLVEARGVLLEVVSLDRRVDGSVVLAEAPAALSRSGPPRRRQPARRIASWATRFASS